MKDMKENCINEKNEVLMVIGPFQIKISVITVMYLKQLSFYRLKNEN